MAVRITVKFNSAVDNPVVGMMIRTRIGSEVYGTNTELERYPLGAMQPGQTVRITYRFACQLCPQEYTITAASHDANGVWHSRMEDALAFAVADSRYTAGVANLRAKSTPKNYNEDISWFMIPLSKGLRVPLRPQPNFGS